MNRGHPRHGNHDCPFAEIEHWPDLLTSAIGRLKEYSLRDIVERGMEDIEDYYLSLEVLERISAGKERVDSSAEVRRNLGMDD